MLTENNLKGLLVLRPQVIDTAAALSPAERKKQVVIIDELLQDAEGEDRAWLVNYKDCLMLYSKDIDAARRASFAASKHAPAFINDKFCQKSRNSQKTTTKKKK